MILICFSSCPLYRDHQMTTTGLKEEEAQIRFQFTVLKYVISVNNCM